MSGPSRRAVLAGFGSLTALAVTAGCSLGGDDEPVPPDRPAVGPADGWFADVPNFEYFRDWTGREAVTVRVGVPNGGEPVGFGPPGIVVDPGTTVTWEWTGAGGPHDVTSAVGNPFFRSETVAEAGHTFRRTVTFDDPTPTLRYACRRHEEAGMKGAIRPPPE